MKKAFYISMLVSLIFSSCRKEEDIVPSTVTKVTEGEAGPVAGFFLLNEGNMGSNKATLDYYDYEAGEYHKNIYAERNPTVVKELGDVGNDIQIYGSKLYAVINCSHLVEVMDVRTAKHVATVSIPNCRYITFHKGYAYVSSYAGPVEIDPNARLGYVAKIDTVTFNREDTCVVGYQPDELVVCGDKLYVANSGGYRVPNYDNTVSVIDLNNFKETKKITVGINLHRMELDNYGNIWVSSRGDYYNIRSKTYVIDTKTDRVVKTLPLLPNSNMTLSGDSLYIYSTEWNYSTGSNTISYAIVNTKTQQMVSRNFITDGTDKKIEIPYGLAVHPETKEILVTDAKDYVTPGKLYCFTPDGKKKWEVTTGDIPAHIVFTRQKLKP
jgi:DNA-binding beta-propeller fold protein YncE